MTDSERFEARVTKAVRKYRRDLIDRDKAAQKRFALQLREAHQALLKELEAARTAVEMSRTRGANENTFRLQRALDMAQQAETLLKQYAQNGTSYIAQEQAAVSKVAYQAAQEFLDTTNPPPPNFPNASSFMTFPTEALETITAATTTGPVAELLNRYGADAAKEAGRILTQAIVLGTHSDVIGRQLSDALAVPLWKGAQIARTEINRAYQESLRETWRQNKHITPKWIWRSGRTSSTCAVCWAMDGTEHDVEEPMGSHPSCRCSMVPASVSWDDLAAQFGIEMPAGDFDPPKELTGPEAFAQLPEADQRAVLGPGKFRAFSAGDIKLEDLVRERRSDDWGMNRSEGSLQRATDLGRERNDLAIASLPKRNWEVPSQRKVVGPSVQNVIGADSNIVRMGDHAWTSIQPPPPGIPTNPAGDATKGKIGQHYSARKYVDNLDRFLSDWKWQGFTPGDSQARRKRGEDSWEFYSPTETNMWLVVVINRRSNGEHFIKTAYLTSAQKVEERVKSRSLRGR